MPFLGITRFRQPSLTKCLQTLILCAGLNSLAAFAAPGAHGPNGEHLDNRITSSGAQKPKFETFTESFELVGELTEHELAIYLHDYRSNVPVANASIEIEVGEQTAEAVYEVADNHYSVTQESFLHAIEAPGEYPVILTIITDDTADLMEATFVVPEFTSEDEEHGHAHETSGEEHDDHDHDVDHHDHFPWWAIPLALLCFLAGYLVNKRQKREVQT